MSGGLAKLGSRAYSFENSSSTTTTTHTPAHPLTHTLRPPLLFARAPGDTGVAPSHEEVLEATEKRSFDMQNLVADICAAMDLKDFPAPKVAEVFAGGAGPVSKASRGGSGGSGGGNQVVLAAAVGGVVGAMIASAVILALRK